MKSAKNIIYKVLSVALLAAVWMLASCDSGFVQKTAESGNTNVTVTVSAGNARTVSPEGSILDYKDWDITFKPTGITTGADEIKSTLNRGELGEISGSFLVPPGTYTVSVHSTPSGWTGQTDNVVVTASGSVPVTVFVRREHTGTGTFSYTLTCLDDALPDKLTAELQPVDGGTSVGLELTLPEASSDYIFRATDVPAGYYQLSVVYTNPDTNEQTELVKYKLDSLIEIIGGLETTGTGEFSISPEPPRTYYAVMDESAADYIGSGIFDRYPAMFDTLMRDNTDVSKWIDVLDAVPVFRKEYIDHLAGGKTVDVYGYIGDGSYSYSVTENGVTISCDAFIADGAAGDEIPVSWEEVSPGDFSLEVNGGVAVSVTGDAFPLGTVTVTVDNPELYTSTPFLKFSQPESAPPVTQFTTPPGSGYYVVSGGDPGTYVLADATTSPAVLWASKDSKNIYVVPQSDISETMVLPEAISISDSSKRGFCFDDRLNLYVASDSGVKRYDRQSAGTYTANSFLTILSDQTVTGVAFDMATNILWVLTYSGSTYTLKGYDNPAGYAVDATTSVAYDYSGTYSGSGAEISSFAVHNGTVYLAMRELTEQVYNIYTAACPVSNELAEISLSKGIGDLAAAAGISEISDNAVISDMSVVDGALYVLFREVSPYNENLSTNFSNSTDNYSRGGVIKLNITGNVSVDTTNVSVDKTFGTGGILGWTTESAGTVSEGAYNCYWPAPGSTDRFYGPSRFIAVAPKKLVIADDGGYYEDSGVIQKNRVVTVDLSGSQPGMTVKELNTVVEFDDTLSASGFGPVIPTGN